MLPADIEAIEANYRHRFKWLVILVMVWGVVFSLEVALLFGTLINQMQPPSTQLIAIPTDTPDPGIGL